MTVHHEGHGVTLHHGDCLDVLRTLPDASVDSVVTDPPYGLEFMGKAWDSFGGDAWRNSAGITGTGYTDGGNRIARPAYGSGDSANPTCATCTGRKRGAKKCTCAEPDWRVKGKPIDKSTSTAAQMRAFGEWCELWAAECLRVLKPGGHLLAFGGTRTWHRLACAVEDAGFEVRDSLAWLYGSGFPKSLDVSKAIDKAAGAEREVVGSGANYGRTRLADGKTAFGDYPGEWDVTAPATDAAREWAGWGTALKPGHEPAVVARKPLQPCDILAGIGSQLDTLEQVWRALEVDPTTPTGAAGCSPDQTGTSQSESTATTSSSTVSSWRACWVELCELTSTSTTETTSSTTTVLRTLSSSLSSLTLESTHPSATSPHGLTAIASAVDNLFASVVCGLRATLALSATEPATGSTPASPLDAAEASAAAFEPVVVARKPLIGTVAANVTTHGTGALNIDASRIGDEERVNPPGSTAPRVAMGDGWRADAEPRTAVGRWPANVILDEDMAGVLDQQSGTSVSQGGSRGAGGQHGAYSPIPAQPDVKPGYGDSGGASRFFYVAKAPKRERPVVDGVAHPTVKPLALMRWLVRLVTPPGGVVLEPFAGSGTTVEACLLEGFRCVAIEKGDEYLPLILERIRRQTEPPEVAELVRTVDPAAAILEQVDGQLDIFGEATA